MKKTVWFKGVRFTVTGCEIGDMNEAVSAVASGFWPMKVILPSLGFVGLVVAINHSGPGWALVGTVAALMILGTAFWLMKVTARKALEASWAVQEYYAQR